MKEQPCILEWDSDTHSVIEPNYEQQPFKFHSKLLFAFVPKEDIDNFCTCCRTLRMFRVDRAAGKGHTF